ncbi:hypothetical protein RHGRI_019300 [Rhododendron griersonianum]|uniref:Uncharacterized protein n=1 Tax=Rhododendron griersonianum TaxID=479676 RepID=A0AAV6JGC5_9ERIC|nr:hypothetical protein RHGRI_019300 [Rhododendron griersonianum]
MVQQKKRTRTTAKGKENAPDRHPLQRNVGIVVRDEQNVNDIRINEAKQMSNKGKEKATYAMGNANEWIQPLRDKNIGIVIRDERDHNVIHVGNGNQNSRVWTGDVELEELQVWRSLDEGKPLQTQLWFKTLGIDVIPSELRTGFPRKIP